MKKMNSNNLNIQEEKINSNNFNIQEDDPEPVGDNDDNVELEANEIHDNGEDKEPVNEMANNEAMIKEVNPSTR